jgi:transposase InsO family protein
VPQAIRDAIVDFVRYWSRRAEIAVGRLLKKLGIPFSKYYDWCKRYGSCNGHNAQVPRSHWMLDWEKAAILGYQREHPEEGYRRLAFMMLDADVVAVSPSSVYRVLKEDGRIEKGGSCPSSKGRGFAQPKAPHEHWHIDISYLNICGTFYYLCSVLDGYSRYIVHWAIRESMTEADVETVLQRAHERFPAAKPRIISDNGPQFVARDFKAFIRLCGMTHVRTSPFYPQSNGKIESWHKTVKRECIRPKTPLNLEDARRIVAHYVQHYNEVRLHAGIGYITPRDRLDGRDEAIRQNRRRKLAEARITRRAAHQTQTGAPSTLLQRSVAAPALP